MKKFIIFLIMFLFLSSCKSSNRQNLFSFDSDERVFTALAFLNVGGYDHDWIKWDTIRVVERKYLDSVLKQDFKEEIREFVNKSNLGWYECAAYALNLDRAPTFSWICDTCNIDLKNKFKGLDLLYRKFYEKSNMKGFWSKYKSTLDSIN